MTFKILTLSIFGIYAAICLFMGIRYSRKQKTSTDYILAGRRLPFIAIAASLIATNNSSANVIGIAGLTYSTGLGFLFWIIVFTTLAYIPMIFYSPMVNRTRANTMPDYVYTRYEKSAFLRAVMCFWTFFWTILRMGIELFAMALLMKTILGIPLHISIIVMGAITVVYTALGGLSAVAMTDVFQWSIMVAGTALTLPFLFLAEGSFSQVVLKNLPSPDFLSLLHPAVPWMTIIGFGIAGTFWPLGDPTLFQRFLAGEDPGTTKKGTALYVAMIYPWWFIMGIIGIFARIVLPDIIPDQSLMLLGRDVLPVVLGAIVFSAIIAGAMSTADSALNTLSAVAMNDIFKVLKPKWNERQLIMSGRIVVIVVGGLGMIAAPIFSGGVLVMALFLQMFFISAVVPLVFLGVMWKRVTKQAAIVSTIVGTIVVVIWAIIGGQAGIAGIPPSIPSLISGTLTLIIMTFLAKSPASETSVVQG